jgi:hypothetical protein
MTRQKTVTIKPRYISQGNRFGHVVHPGYKRTSTLGGAFDDTRIIARIGLVPAVVITAFFVACACAAFLIIIALHGAN